jgi:hypothetical protein
MDGFPESTRSSGEESSVKSAQIERQQPRSGELAGRVSRFFSVLSGTIFTFPLSAWGATASCGVVDLVPRRWRTTLRPAGSRLREAR